VEKKPVSEENKAIARHARDAVGGNVKVFKYVHDALPLDIGIVSSIGQPREGITSYATVGLSDVPMLKDNAEEFPIRIELCGMCYSEHDRFANVLAGAAFYIMRHRRLCCPGYVLPNADHLPEISVTLRHLYFTAPFEWQGKLQTLEFPTKRVAWLMAIPISDSELKFREVEGDKAFESLLESRDAQIADPSRPSNV
jgi:hypothetical protein